MMKHAATTALYAYWDRLRAGRAAPERSDLDPAAIRGLLGDVFLLELNGVVRYAVRLAGTRICALLGRELKDRPFAEPFAPEDWPDLYALLDGVAATAIPAVAGLLGETADGRKLDLELAVLPLKHRGRTHARLLGSLAALEVPYWAGLVPLSRLRLVSIRHLHRNHGPAGDDIDLLTPPRRAAAGRLRLLPGGRG
ncbi:MAG: PAS domain-containing protein [Xanthobacteraceae bacterium]|nr:PAS domain-containing protein [Xanthobacteraceae bacterium]